MLHVTVIAVGRLKERYWMDACNEYLKRLRAYADVKVIEVADLDPARHGGERKAQEQEGIAMLDAIPEGSRIILCDIGGKPVTSEDMAGKLEQMAIEGENDVTFLIGGSTGVSDKVRAAADSKWSFGRITLPHNLARVVLLEQLYRAFKIIRHEPYHK